MIKNKKAAVSPKIMGVIVVVALALIIYYGYFRTASVDDLGGPITSTTSTLVEDNAQYSVYELTWSGDNILNSGRCTDTSIYTFNFDIGFFNRQQLSQLPKFADNIDTSQKGIAQSANFFSTVVVNPCSDLARSGNAVMNNTKIDCSISNPIDFAGEIKAKITCNVKGDVLVFDNNNPSHGSVSGLSSGTIKVKFFKLGTNSDAQIQNNVVNNPVSSDSSVAVTKSWFQKIIDSFNNFINKILGK